MILDLLVVATLAVVLGRWALLMGLAGRRGRPEHPLGHTPVTVVLPAWNEAMVIGATIDAVLSSPQVAQLIVVDDGSTDGTADVVRARAERDERVRLVAQPTNQGKSAALNRGFEVAANMVVVTVDADTHPEPTAISRLVAALDDPLVAAAAATIRVDRTNGALTRWQRLEYVTSMNLVRRAYALLGGLATVPGCLSAWRRDVVVQAGGFRGRTLAEDTDLTLVVQGRGHRVAMVDDAIAYTQAPDTVSSFLAQRRRWLRGNLQCAWLHRGLLWQGPAGLRRGALPDLWWTHLGMFLVAPLPLLWFPHGLSHMSVGSMWVATGCLWLLDAVGAAFALWLERERPSLLWSLPLQRVVYPFLLGAVFALVVAEVLTGRAPRWRPVARRAPASGDARPEAR
ncbi:MAG: glycosyltransferase [Myxococcota bacterium]